jgi:hypothetical protein
MSIPAINLNALEYEDIYDSIQTYISGKTEFTDYDFSGSGLSTILDLLTYNTYYQLIFQNILVNEMFIDSSQKFESLVSHAKLHGYTIQRSYASNINVTVTAFPGNETNYAKYTPHIATATDGSEMTFYVGVDPEFTLIDGLMHADVILYEGQSLVTGAELTPDLIKQSCFIPTQNFDFRTLRVEVSVGGTEDGFEEYRLGSANEANIYADSKVYFLDGNGQGFDVKFVSGQIDPSTGQSVGNSLTDSSRVRVSYIIPSGSVANGITSIQPAAGPVTVEPLNGESSSGGRTTLSAADLKFFIPRTFSAQNRIVTMSDIKSALMSKFGYTETNISVASGADLTNQVSGTVYIFVNGFSNGSTDAQNIIDYIKSIGMLGISYIYDTNLGE